MPKRHILLLVSIPIVVILLAAQNETSSDATASFLGSAEFNSTQMIRQGRDTFRFDTFGDEAFWGGQLRLHEAVNQLTPRQALQLGLKVDSDALPAAVIHAIKSHAVNLNDPMVTLLLIKLNAVLGVKGFFNENGTLKSLGLTCAICHSTVDNSIAAGIGGSGKSLAFSRALMNP